MKNVIERAEVQVVVNDDPVQALLDREVRQAEQQIEIQKALSRAKGCLDEMVEMFQQVKGMMEDEQPEQLRKIADAFADMEYVDPEQGEEIRKAVMAICMGMTERGVSGPVPISSDTKYQLAAKMAEQVRKTAETISKIAKDHFDIGKAAMIPKHVLLGHVPMFVGLISKVADGDDDRYKRGISELQRVFASIDQKVEESK